MKKYSFLLILMLSFLSTYSQERKPNIDVGLEYHSGDTTRFFNITNIDFVKYKQKLIELWGQPYQNNIRYIVWKNVNIQGVGTGLTIKMYDGMLNLNKTEVDFKVFVDAKQKGRELNKVSKTYFRVLSLRVENSDKQNIINNQHKQQKIMDCLLLRGIGREE